MNIELEDIKLKKEITEPGDDGRKFIFDVNGRDVEVGVSGTAIDTENFSDEDIIDRLTHFIKLSIDSHDEEISIIKIEIVAHNKNGWKVIVSGRKTIDFLVDSI